MLALLLACTQPDCPEGFVRDVDGNCYPEVATPTTPSTPTGTDTDTPTTPPDPAPEIVYYEQLWPEEDEGWVSMHYHAYDIDDDVIGGRYYASVVNQEDPRNFIVDVEIIWADDRCPAGTHSAFECCTLYLNNVLTMYIAGVDQSTSWTVTAFITDEEGHTSNTSVETADVSLSSL